jgi:hypothetical protein
MAKAVVSICEEIPVRRAVLARQAGRPILTEV